MWIYAITVLSLGSVQLADGSIIVLENSNLAVELVTKSEITHVAIVFTEEQRTWVYEATPKVVRKVSWDDYLEEIRESNRWRSDENKRIRLKLLKPKVPYSSAEKRTMLEFAKSQLGRRYSIRGYVRDRAGEGIHCAEFVSTALHKTGRYDFQQNYAISPAELVGNLRATHCEFPWMDASRDMASRDSWCRRSWNWWRGAFTWCSWACYETWKFYP